MEQPDISRLSEILGLEFPILGFYDVPDCTVFDDLIHPDGCIFKYARDWCVGRSVVLSPKHIGCRGAGYWLCAVPTRSPEQLASFLYDEEGLKDSIETMHRWLDDNPPFTPRHESIVIGPLKTEMYEYLHTATFIVTPDQLAMLITGVEYRNAGHSPLTRAPFGSGCMQLAPLIEAGDIPAAWISLTDMAMREFLPLSVLGFTVTRPMFEQLCGLETDSFIGKRFWQELSKARASDRAS